MRLQRHLALKRGTRSWPLQIWSCACGLGIAVVVYETSLLGNRVSVVAAKPWTLTLAASLCLSGLQKQAPASLTGWILGRAWRRVVTWGQGNVGRHPGGYQEGNLKGKSCMQPKEECSLIERGPVTRQLFPRSPGSAPSELQRTRVQ